MFTSENYLGYNGSIYRREGVSLYRRLELYLPSATGTYNEPIETTFHKLVARLESGELSPSLADGLHYQLLPGSDKLVTCKAA